MSSNSNFYAKFHTNPLSREEEYELGYKIQEMVKLEELKKETEEQGKTFYDTANRRKIMLDGQKAIDKLTRANIRLVYDRAHDYKENNVPLMSIEDLVQEGMCGLTVAARKYDPSRGNKFSTVAYRWIMQAIHRGVNKAGRTVRLPENRINQLVMIHRIEQRASFEGYNDKQIDEIICEEMSMTPETLSQIRRASGTPASLDKKIAISGDNGGTLMDFIASEEKTEDGEHEYHQKEALDFLNDTIIKMDESHKAVLISCMSGKTKTRACEELNIKPGEYQKILDEATEFLRDVLISSGYSYDELSVAISSRSEREQLASR